MPAPRSSLYLDAEAAPVTVSLCDRCRCDELGRAIFRLVCWQTVALVVAMVAGLGAVAGLIEKLSRGR